MYRRPTYRNSYKKKCIIIDENNNNYEGEFIDKRIRKSTVPDNLHIYDFRHDIDDWDKLLTLEEIVNIDFGGHFITENFINFELKYNKCIKIKNILMN